ncbi:MAG: MFS transporter [Acidimicrobiales bacterium]
MKALLAERNARRYLAGQAFSLYGDVALWLAMGIWVKELTGSSGEAGLTFFFFGLASLMSPLAGLVVDRVRRRPLLLVANLTGAVVVLGLLFVHGKGQVWLIWLVTFVYGLVYTFLSSGQSALLATMLPSEMLVDANGFLQTVREGLRLVGPLTGAGLFAVFGGGTVAVLDSATFLIAAVTLMFVHVTETKPVPVEQHWLAEVTAGARHVWRTTVLRQMLIATAVACLVFGFFESIGFAVVTTGLRRPATFLGVVIAVQGVGALAGGISSSKVIRRFGAGPVAGAGLVLVALASLLFATRSLALVFAAAVVFGVCLPWILVGLMTLLQTSTPNELQGRVSSAADTLLSLPQTLSIAVGAILVGMVDYRYLLVVIAVVVTGAAAYLLSRPEQWQVARARAAVDASCSRVPLDSSA